MDIRGQESFKYQTDMANAQRAMNNEMSDYLLAIEAKPAFEEYYSAFKFGFGSNWMKPLFKQYFWWGYFAGYKEANK